MEQHSLVRSLVLHLLPGELITLFFALVAPALARAGYPSLFALYLAILVVLIPFELGYLYYVGRRQNGKWSLRGVVDFHEPLPLWQYFVLVPVLLAWAAFVFMVITKPIDGYLIAKVFGWLPAWFFSGSADMTQYSSIVLKTTFLAGMALNGVLGPLVEELYFRGYLLPRISRFGWGAPLINIILFSLYHFFSPWQNPARILALLPDIYAVWWTKNIKVGIWVHCLLNSVGMLMSVRLYFH